MACSPSTTKNKKIIESKAAKEVREILSAISEEEQFGRKEQDQDKTKTAESENEANFRNKAQEKSGEVMEKVKNGLGQLYSLIASTKKENNKDLTKERALVSIENTDLKTFYPTLKKRLADWIIRKKLFQKTKEEFV